jgi:hypothetical protein
MTMLAHTGRPSGRPLRAPQSRSLAGAGASRSYLTTIKRFFVSLLVVLTAGMALAAAMALKIAVYLPRLIHH